MGASHDLRNRLPAFAALLFAGATLRVGCDPHRDPIDSISRNVETSPDKAVATDQESVASIRQLIATDHPKNYGGIITDPDFIASRVEKIKQLIGSQNPAENPNSLLRQAEFEYLRDSTSVALKDPNCLLLDYYYLSKDGVITKLQLLGDLEVLDAFSRQTAIIDNPELRLNIIAMPFSQRVLGSVLVPILNEEIRKQSS